MLWFLQQWKEPAGHTVCNIAHCEKAAVWQSVSSVQATLPQDQYIHSCRTLVSQNSRRHAAQRRQTWLTAEGEKENRWMWAVLVFEGLSFLTATQHIQYMYSTHTHTHKFRAWMGMINPNYDGNFLGEVIVQQQDSWSTSELPAENLNVLIMLNMCSGELLHCGRFVERCWSEQRYNTTNNNTNKTHINHYSGQSVFCSCLQTVCVWFWSGRVGVHFM